jgi:WD40 repeat protein
VTSVAFSPDGKYVIAGSSDGTARVWELATGRKIIRSVCSLTDVAFSPDGKHVVSWGNVRGAPRVFTICVWEAITGGEVTHMGHNGTVYSVAFSPDGKYVVSGSADRTARVWEAATGKEIARMTHDGEVYSVAFSPDGKYVVSSGGLDGTARVWEAETGKEIARMTHDSGVFSVAFSPDRKYVVSGSWDGTVRVWIYRPEDLIADACSRLSRNLTRAEWEQYIGDALPYQAICPNLPIESETTPTVTP